MAVVLGFATLLVVLAWTSSSSPLLLVLAGALIVAAVVALGTARVSARPDDHRDLAGGTSDDEPDDDDADLIFLDRSSVPHEAQFAKPQSALTKQNPAGLDPTEQAHEGPDEIGPKNANHGEDTELAADDDHRVGLEAREITTLEELLAWITITNYKGRPAGRGSWLMRLGTRKAAKIRLDDSVEWILPPSTGLTAGDHVTLQWIPARSLRSR